MTRHLLVFALGLFFIVHANHGEEKGTDILFEDFEGETYGKWVSSGGSAFGKGPARGTLPNQMPVSGFSGQGLVNSFSEGDQSTGTLTSPEFSIERKYISFLIGGGAHPGKTCMNLVIGGEPVRTASGPNSESGGSEQLELSFWDVADYQGQRAHIEIVDTATGGWGHINVDHIVFTNQKPSVPLSNATRTLQVTSRYLHLPVRTGAPKRKVAVRVNGRVERSFDIELADNDPEWFAPLDASAWRGQELTIQVDKLPAKSRALEEIRQGNELLGAGELYREPLRPQIHFSPRRGWNNDPNGLVYFNGVYHLFFQHNPYGWNWGNMHWGHAVSKDLVHWTEQGTALYPDEMGTMFSGSAVIDWQNTSGLGKGGQPPMILLYTAAGNPTVQCLAYSNDQGKTFTKYAGNPIIKEITPGNRDPKVIWHEPTRRWVMVLYVEVPEKRHTVHFFTSGDLKEWKLESQFEGLFECPDLFPLALDGKPEQTKWIVTGASSEYFVGSFDGRKFTAETPKLKGHVGRGFYAAQTFSDIPEEDGRRIQIGWLQAPSPGMPFNQAMSVPLELRLVSTADGPRMAWSPVRELDALRHTETAPDVQSLNPGEANPLENVSGELLDVVAELEPSPTATVRLTVRGVPIIYDVAKQQLTVNGHEASAPLRNGKLDLRILTDRTALEVFASGGLTYVPMPVIAKPEARAVNLAVEGGPAMFSRLEVHQLRSIWGKQ